MTVPAGARQAVAQVAANDSMVGTPLSLDDAVLAAENASPVLHIARNAVTRAQGQQYQARSGLFPQLNGSAGYTRTLQSQFQAALSSWSVVRYDDTPGRSGSSM